MQHPETAPENYADRLREELRRLVLLKETGPKSAAWHRARVQAIWRLHRLIAAQDADAVERRG